MVAVVQAVPAVTVMPHVSDDKPDRKGPSTFMVGTS